MTAIGLVLIILALWFIWMSDNNTSGTTIVIEVATLWLGVLLVIAGVIKFVWQVMP